MVWRTRRRRSLACSKEKTSASQSCASIDRCKKPDRVSAEYRVTFGIGSTKGNRRSSFSNYGGDVSYGAPGEKLITTYPDNLYSQVSGTSFSVGWTSGCACRTRGDARDQGIGVVAVRSLRSTLIVSASDGSITSATGNTGPA